MGHRDVKRVSLDFIWAKNKVWKGYINPYRGPKSCPICDGTGYNEATKKIADEYYDHEGFGVRWRYAYGVAPDGTPASRPPWRIIGECRSWQNKLTQEEVQALVDAGRLWDFTRVPRTEEQVAIVKKKIADGGNSWLPFDNGYIPSAEEINAWSHSGFGHDGINRGIVIEARAKRLRVWGKCLRCKGKGELKLPRKMKKRYKNWKDYEPPTGEGWQLWETVSEGSPISPVFANPAKLAEWCEKNATIFADTKMPKEKWLEMFVGKDCDVDTGSMMVMINGYIGPVATMPQ